MKTKKKSNLKYRMTEDTKDQVKKIRIKGLTEAKVKAIERAWTDKAGFGSIALTVKEAKKIDPSVTANDFKEWKAKQDVGQKAKMRGMNSFIANKPKEEYQMDLFFMADQDVAKKYKSALLMVDIFTKWTQVVMVPGKKWWQVLPGIKKLIPMMDGKPKTIYSDDEGAFNSKEIQKYFNDEGIRHLVTRSHAPVAERQIRTFKNMIYKRLEAPINEGKQWFDLLDQVLVTYNHGREHSSTKKTPHEARQNKNQQVVKFNLELTRQHSRKYPEISVGDTVRVYKKKDKLDKERVSNYLPKKFKVVAIETSFGQQFYRVEGMARALMRSELLRIDE